MVEYQTSQAMKVPQIAAALLLNGALPLLVRLFPLQTLTLVEEEQVFTVVAPEHPMRRPSSVAAWP